MLDPKLSELNECIIFTLERLRGIHSLRCVYLSKNINFDETFREFKAFHDIEIAEEIDDDMLAQISINSVPLVLISIYDLLEDMIREYIEMGDDSESLAALTDHIVINYEEFLKEHLK